jgi:DNA-binding transcriptional ArsR family regulator
MHETACESTRSKVHVSEDLKAAADLLRTLGSPVRLAILRQLAEAELCVHEIVDELHDDGNQVSQPLVSQHLRVLRQNGLVRTRRRGREVAYTLSDSHIGHIVADAVSHVGHPADAPDAEPHSH